MAKNKSLDFCIQEQKSVEVVLSIQKNVSKKLNSFGFLYTVKLANTLYRPLKL